MAEKSNPPFLCFGDGEKKKNSLYLLELYTAVLPAVFSVSVFCRYQICWIFGISVGIVPPFFEYFPPFLPPFFQKGVELLKKGAIAPLLRKKGGTAPFLIPKCTDRVFLRYRYGIYREIPTEYRPKIPIRDTTLVNTYRMSLFPIVTC
jgi:hypothetical protein